MTVARLAETTLALASELRDLALELEPRVAELWVGTPVVKAVSGRRYWYLQSRGGGLEVQRYLGPETPELLERIAAERRRRAELAPELEHLARLNEMAVAGGVVAESAAATRVLQLLAEAGLFRAGAVLVGTRAFLAYGPLLGFRPAAAARTEDFDVAVGPSVALALPRDERGRLPARLAETSPPFLPVPDLDPRRPSTSFKLRGRELRVDFVTPLRGREKERPLSLRRLGVAAWPLRLLDFLVAKALPAVLSGTAPVLVRVPEPARFALHKLWLARRRRTGEAARAAKDRAQAAALLELLVEDRPRDLACAAKELRRRPRAFATVRAEVKRLPQALRDTVAEVVGENS